MASMTINKCLQNVLKKSWKFLAVSTGLQKKQCTEKKKESYLCYSDSNTSPQILYFSQAQNIAFHHFRQSIK